MVGDGGEVDIGKRVRKISQRGKESGGRPRNIWSEASNDRGISLNIHNDHYPTHAKAALPTSEKLGKAAVVRS